MREEVARGVSQEMLARIKAEFPLQGKIIALEGQDITLDIGKNSGVKKGQRFEVISDVSGVKKQLGVLEVIAVDQSRSLGKLNTWNSNIKAGLTIREL